MQLQELWLVLAGFVLGFAVSTLWEWLYYRRQRWRRYVQPLASTARSYDAEISAFETETPVAPTATQFNAEYRSPGVFLESEQESQHLRRETSRPSAESA